MLKGHYFLLKKLIVAVLGKITDILAAIIPPPAPTDLVQFHLNPPAAGKQLSFCVHVHDVTRMSLSSQQKTRKPLSFRDLSAHRPKERREGKTVVSTCRI